MTKRQAAHMVCYVVIAIEEKVRGVSIRGWTQFFTDVHLFWLVAAAAALAITGFLMKSDGHAQPPIGVKAQAAHLNAERRGLGARNVPTMSPSYPRTGG